MTSETKLNGASWSTIEFSYLYHLIMWGYAAQDVYAIAKKFLKSRTEDGIKTQASTMRKWISKVHGYPVSNYTITRRMESLFMNASMIPPGSILSTYKTHAEDMGAIPVKVVGGENSIDSPRPVKIQQPVILPSDKEPDIIDVMRMGKELGVTEIEYKGMKIKY